MITNTDVKKLVKEFKKVFSTKEDIKNLNEKIDQVFLRLAEDIGNVMVEVKGSSNEIRTHRAQIGDHEDRLQKVEHKVFPQ